MIGIICIGQIELSPFVKKYTSVMDEENISYEIVHWNRSGVKRENDDVNHTFSLPLDRYKSLLKKLVPFVKFRGFVKRIVREKKYDKLIVLTTQTAVMIPDVLHKYRGRYFFDYRDASYEYIKPYSAFINRIVLNSAYTAVSSPGFRELLTDKKELILSHNFQIENYAKRVQNCEKRSGGPIVMGYIGHLREYEYLKRFADAFGEDKRFEFHIHGSGDCVEDLREYVKKYDNVKVFGAYDEKDKMDIIDTFDMICYNYPKSFVNYPAVANKFYDGLIRKKPMFGNLDTFSGRLVSENGLGISLHETEGDFTDKIYDYYREFDENVFAANCEGFLEKVIADDRTYMEKIREFVR